MPLMSVRLSALPPRDFPSPPASAALAGSKPLAAALFRNRFLGKLRRNQIRRIFDTGLVGPFDQVRNLSSSTPR